MSRRPWPASVIRFSCETAKAESLVSLSKSVGIEPDQHRLIDLPFSTGLTALSRPVNENGVNPVATKPGKSSIVLWRRLNHDTLVVIRRVLPRAPVQGMDLDLDPLIHARLTKS